MVSNGWRQTGRATGPRLTGPPEHIPAASRPWWFTEHMRLGWVQIFAGVGGLIFPAYLFVAGIRAARTALTPILAVALLGAGLYALAQSRFLTEIETVGDEVRLAASVITIVGIVAIVAFLAGMTICLTVVFLLLWPLILTQVGQMATRLVGFLVNTLRSLFSRNE